MSTIRTYLHLFHNNMEVKTVLNLEADTRGLCKDTITNAEEVRKRNYQKIFYPVFFEMGDDTACSNRILDWFYRCFHLKSLLVLTCNKFVPSLHTYTLPGRASFLIGITHDGLPTRYLT